jgi:hypothetical protein
VSRLRLPVLLAVTGLAVTLGVPVAWWATRPAASAGAPPTMTRPDSAVIAPAGPGAPTDRPAAARPRTTGGGRAAAEPPVRLRIPALGVDAPVDPVGVTPAGSMVVPERVSRVGWYRFGPAPGAAAGSVVLAGHVDSAREGRGALFDLRSAPVGTRVELVTAAGRTVAYRVTGRETVAKRRLPAERLFDRDGVPRLVLVTCGGPFDRAASAYRDNVVVGAEPLGGP